MIEGTGTAATAQGGSAETASKLALLSKQPRKGKTAGKTGLASALERTGPKGKGSFSSLVNALAARKDGAHDAASSLKLLGLKAASAGTGKPDALEGFSHGQQVQGLASGQEAPKDEKTAGRKKAANPQAVTVAALAIQAMPFADVPRVHEQKAKAAAGDVSAEQKAAATGAGRLQEKEPTVRIVDLRARPRHASSEDAAAAKAAMQPAASDKDAGAALAQKPGQPRDFSVPFADRAPTAASVPAQTSMERLREMAGSELLKATNLVLRDGGGEIRLVLRPESLGSVRIRMNVVDNSIEGRIIVDSSSVKQVFDANIDALRRALTAEGFQTGSLQVSVGGQNTDADARREQQPPEVVRRVTAQGFERNIPGVENMSLGDLLVNLFV